MSDFFRITKGLEIDNQMRVMFSAGPPGGTTDTDAALVGSVCTDKLTGDFYTKRVAGTGTNKWFTPTQPSIILYQENVSTPVPPAAMGANSIVLGSGAQAAAANSLAIGDQSLSRIPGGVVQANGRFASSGDAQTGRYLLRGHTVTSSFTEIFVDGTGGTTQLVLPDDSTWTFKGTVTGHRTDVGDGHAGFSFEGVIYRGAGVASVAMVGKPTISTISKTNRQWDIAIAADTTNGALKISCLGQSGKIIRWVALIETVEVTN